VSGHSAADAHLIVLAADGRDKVFSYYESALNKDPWQLASTFSTEELDTLQFSDAGDPDISGVVSIARGGDDNRTSVLISLQDAGAFRQQLPPFKLQESLAVPKEFPSDIPVYEGATVTGSAFVREPGDESLRDLLTRTARQGDGLLPERLPAARLDRASRGPLGVEQRFSFRTLPAFQGDVLVVVRARSELHGGAHPGRRTPSREPAGRTPRRRRLPPSSTPATTAAASTPQASGAKRIAEARSDPRLVHPGWAAGRSCLPVGTYFPAR
jgi:hypothetical protein